MVWFFSLGPLLIYVQMVHPHFDLGRLLWAYSDFGWRGWVCWNNSADIYVCKIAHSPWVNSLSIKKNRIKKTKLKLWSCRHYAFTEVIFCPSFSSIFMVMQDIHLENYNKILTLIYLSCLLPKDKILLVVHCLMSLSEFRLMGWCIG